MCAFRHVKLKCFSSCHMALMWHFYLLKVKQGMFLKTAFYSSKMQRTKRENQLFSILPVLISENNIFILHKIS